LRTLHIKAARKTAATDILAIRRMIIALMRNMIDIKQKYFYAESCHVIWLRGGTDFNHGNCRNGLVRAEICLHPERLPGQMIAGTNARM